MPYPNRQIIHGFQKGRQDSYYSNKNQKCKGGISVFDSNCSIIFNFKLKRYFLYFRSNIGTGNRYISIYIFRRYEILV